MCLILGFMMMPVMIPVLVLWCFFGMVVMCESRECCLLLASRTAVEGMDQPFYYIVASPMYYRVAII